MASLFHKHPSPSPDKGRSLPPEIRQLISNLKAEHPGFRPHEIARICFLHFGRKPSDHTIKHVLADGPKPTVTTRRYPPYAQIPDPYQRRRAIVDLHAEGWSNTSISAYLQTPRHRVTRCSNGGPRKAMRGWMINLRPRIVPHAKPR